MQTLNCSDNLFPKGNNGQLLRKWLTLAAGILAAGLFVYLYIAGLGKLPGGQAHLEMLREGDFRSGAYFYTDVEQVRTATLYLNDSKNYPPREVTK